MKYGLLERGNDPRIPHWSALRLQPGITLPAAPASISYVRGIPGIGMFGNQDWGCCALISSEFIKATCKTPYGLPLSVWQEQMSALREAA